MFRFIFYFKHGKQRSKIWRWNKATDEEIADFEAEVQNNLDYIQKIIINNEKSREKDNSFKVSMPVFSLLSPILPILNKMYNVDFYSDSKCLGCGTFEKVCLSGKIKVINKKPVWQEDVQCFYCHSFQIFWDQLKNLIKY